MPRGDIRWREAKKPKKSKIKPLSPTQILASPPEPEVIRPKRKKAEEEEEEQR